MTLRMTIRQVMSIDDLRSLIGTCLLARVSVVAWLESFFNDIFNGYTDAPNLLPEY